MSQNLKVDIEASFCSLELSEEDEENPNFLNPSHHLSARRWVQLKQIYKGERLKQTITNP